MSDDPSSPSSDDATGSASPDSAPRQRLNPRTKPMSNFASKAFVIGAFLFIFGLGTVGSYFLVNVAETALDRDPAVQDSTANIGERPDAAPDSVARQAPNPENLDS